MVNVFSWSQKKVFSPPYLYLMYEDGIVGEHSLHSYGSVGREVKRCRDKAIFCRLHWQERRALVVNEHCYVSFVSFRSFEISSTRVEKKECVVRAAKKSEEGHPLLVISWYIVAKWHKWVQENINVKVLYVQGSWELRLSGLSCLSEPVWTSPGNVCTAGAALDWLRTLEFQLSH